MQQTVLPHITHAAQLISVLNVVRNNSEIYPDDIVKNASELAQDLQVILQDPDSYTALDVLYIAKKLEALTSPHIYNDNTTSSNLAGQIATDTRKIIDTIYSSQKMIPDPPSNVELHDIQALRRLFDQQAIAINEKTAEMQSKLNALDHNFSVKTGSVAETAEVANNEIESLLKNFQKLASNKSNTLIHQDYKSSANAERNVANIFRFLSIAFMVAAGSFALSFVYTYTSENMSYGQIALKIAASLIISIPAAYFARESSKHRRQQYLYQQFYLNLNALPLFIAELDTDSKNKIKYELAKILFTASHESPGKTDAYPINVQELLTALINRVDPERNKK